MLAFMDALTIENVRCFKGPHSIRLAPLTLLVGENSTGKSTLLSMVRIAWDLKNRIGSPDFNEPPFQLGNYDRIAHYHGGQAKRALSFCVGFDIHIPKRLSDPSTQLFPDESPTLLKAEYRFVPIEGRPEVAEWEVSQGRRSVRLAKEEESSELTLTIRHNDDLVKIRGTDKHPIPEPRIGTRILDDMFYLFRYPDEGRRHRWKVEGEVSPAMIKFLQLVGRGLRDREDARPFAMAPIRTEPDWIYQVGSERPTPAGAHAPAALSRLVGSKSSANQSAIDNIIAFGKASGLFEELEIQRVGKTTLSDAFQVLVQIKNQARESNIVDVGYGVSQSLPILVEALASSNPLLLIQQPEVHLHPRAQAELGTLLAGCAKDQRRKIIVETHSDYLLDRICICVRTGQIAPERVLIHYLEHGGSGGVRIHPINVDSMGNIIGAPPSYRAFFLNESRTLLGG